MSTIDGYTINVNSASKVIDISVRGSFTPEQAKAFHTDYQTKVGSITAKDFTLKVDCTDMNVITQDMVPKLEISFKMYKDSGFKEVQFLIFKSVIVKMQLSRVARSIGLNNAVFLEM